MNRRHFFATSAAAALPAVTPVAAAPRLGQPKLGCQSAPTNDSHLKYFARYGVESIVGYPQIEGDRLYATVDELKRTRELCEKNHVKLDCIAPPFLESSHIDKEKHPAIMLGESPQRDRDIEQLQTMIKNCAEAGIPGIRYTLSIVGNTRSGEVPGRGDATYVSSNMADYRGGEKTAIKGRNLNSVINKPITKAGRITSDMYWERITYFLDRVVPVANQYKVKLASHMEDA